MEVLGLGWQTDLALLERSGSTVEHHPTFVVVRTPGNPGYYWGNLVLLRRAPLRRDAEHALDLFAEHLPAARHVAIGVDDPEATTADLHALADLGLDVSVARVLTARAGELTAPTRRVEAHLRTLSGDADWDARLELALEVAGPHAPAYAEFAVERHASQRRLAESGEGVWLGAFVEHRLVAGLGVVRATPSTVRYQEVETHPSWRHRGLAGALVHRAGREARDALGASTLVIVADPDHPAIGLYRTLGFTDTEGQPQAQREPLRRP